MHRRAGEALPEPSWTGKKEEPPIHRTHKVIDVLRLVDIKKITSDYLLELEYVCSHTLHIIIIASMRILICIHMNTS